MKIKLFYFINSCIFAILTSTNNQIDKCHSQFKEKEQNICWKYKKVKLRTILPSSNNRTSK